MISCKQAVLLLTLVFGVVIYWQYQGNIYLVKELNYRDAYAHNLDVRLKSSQKEIEHLGESLNETKDKLAHTEQTLEELNESLAIAEKIIEKLNYSGERDTYIIGVKEGEGLLTPLKTEVRSGKGNLLLDTTGVLFEEDTQRTMKNAYNLAQDLLEKNLSDKDVIFHMINPFNATVTIGGGSAGAVMALSLIAILDNREIKEDVLVTGGIKVDGEITEVTYIREKAKAAKEANATMLLVPVGQKQYVEGLDVVEVTGIREVMDYMLR